MQYQTIDELFSHARGVLEVVSTGFTPERKAEIKKNAQNPKSNVNRSMERVNPKLRQNINQNRKASNARASAKAGTYKANIPLQSPIVNKAKEFVGKAKKEVGAAKSDWETFKGDPAVKDTVAKVQGNKHVQRATNFVKGVRDLPKPAKVGLGMAALGTYAAYRGLKGARKAYRRKKAERRMRMAARARGRRYYEHAAAEARVILEAAKKKSDKKESTVRVSKEGKPYGSRRALKEMMDPSSMHQGRTTLSPEGPINKVFSRSMDRGMKALKKDVQVPISRTKMAIKHYARGHKSARKGNLHGKVQMARAKLILKRRAPVAAAAVAGGLGGAVLPAVSAPVGAVAASKAAQKFLSKHKK